MATDVKYLCPCGSTTPGYEWHDVGDAPAIRAGTYRSGIVCDDPRCGKSMNRVGHCATLDEALGCATCIAEGNRARAEVELERIGRNIVSQPVMTAFPEPAPTPATPTILEEAGLLVNNGGDRNDAYDHPRHNFGKIATVWSTIFGIEVTTRQVALAMIGMKLVRDSHKARRDNIVDIAGYARCIERLDEPEN